MYKISKREMDALGSAIKKWVEIINNGSKDEGPNNCPLCKIHFKDMCRNCIIKIDAEHPNCRNTPYIKWIEHHRINHSSIDFRCICPDCIEFASAEIKYLIALESRCVVE